jgi:pSer/pThr/pTyr-binding forkhead associated (FHA) protein
MRAPSDFDRYVASLIVVCGEEEGEEHRVERPRWLLGQGPDVGAAFDDSQMAPMHTAIEFEAGRFRICDLESGTGTRVNGSPVTTCELRHGDRIEIGSLVFQILIERKDAVPVFGATPSL